MPESTVSDNAIVYVDFNLDKALLTLRFIVEAQPEMRLQRLLKRGMYDEAEEFAKIYNLDVQRVYSARIQELIEQVADTNENSIFSEVLKYCDLITDNNEVGEICIAGALKSRVFDWVVGFLSYAEKRNITDSTKQELTKYRYALASYRMIYGTKPNVGSNSNWVLFIAGTSFSDIFYELCQTGRINEARLLWHRHIGPIRDYLSVFENLKTIINCFYEAIITNSKIVTFVMDFLAYEIIPFALFQSLNEFSDGSNSLLLTSGKLFIDFVIRIARSLEGLCSENFPLNSLNVVLTIMQSLNFIKESYSTPDAQAKVLLIFARLNIHSRNSEEPMGALNLYAENLTKLVRLYQVYHCRMSYDDYLLQTKESICFLILERVHAVHLVKEHVEKFAIPYMKECNLKKDETLYTYICKVAQYGASIKAQTNPWDELCLTICETISNAQLKCKAVIDIAKRALPPWSKQLTEMVKKMINSVGIDRSLIDELRRQCSLSELGQIFLCYHIPVDKRHDVHNINLLKGLICYIYCNKERPIATKIDDALKIIELIKKLGVSNVPTQVDCYQLYAMRAIVESMPTGDEEINMQPLIEFIEAIKVKDIRESVSNALILNWEYMIGGKEYSFGKVLPKKRLILISAVLCVLERFLPCSDVSLDKSQLFRNIRKLQTDYNLYISTLEFQELEKRIGYLNNFIRNKKEKATITEVITFGNLLHFDQFTSIKTYITLNTDSIKNASALCQLLLCGERLNENHHQFVVDAVCLILEDMVKLSERNETDIIIQLAKELKFVATRLAFSSSKCLTQDQKIETFIFRLYGYMSLFDQLLNQCIKDEQPMETESLDTSFIYKKLHGKNYEISRRIGTFMPQNEGHVFETSQAVNLFANVSLSIVPVNSSNAEEFNKIMLDDWALLFDFLSMHNQTLLEIMARSFAMNLDCFSNAQEFVLGNLQKNISDICQKILSEPVADLWLAAYLILSLENKEIIKLVNSLRQWCSTKKNMRVNLNLICLTQFILIMLKDTHYETKLNQWFTITYWQKLLGKHGIVSSVSLPMEKLMIDFVREQIPPSVLKQYCIDFKLDCNSILLEYGISLCYKAAIENSQEKCYSALNVADAALREIEFDSHQLFNQLFDVLQKINPYNYEVIESIVSAMKKAAKNEAQEKTVDDCYVILKFLNLFSRQNDFTAMELNWYKNFLKVAVLDCATNSDLSDESLHEVSSRPSLAAMQELYDQTRMAPSDLPPLALTRLPFHIFFIHDKIQEIVMPIVTNELSIYNVQDWCSAIECCKYYMRLSRTMLMISAISNKINETVARDCDLEDSDLDIIRDLLMEAKSANRMMLLQGLSTNFKVLPLCRTKLRVLRLGLQVTQIWLDGSDSDEGTRQKLEMSKSMLTMALCLYTTHFILNENGLLNSVTSDLSSRPLELLHHLFVNETNWSEPADIELKVKICNEIAQANESNINEVHEKLIDCWLPGAEQTVVYADPNATFEFGDVQAGAHNDAEKDLILSIPYMEPAISRIVQILRARDPKSIADILYKKLNEDESKLPGGYNTKIRIICCLLRSLTEDQLLEFLNFDYIKIITQLINMLIDRLLEISNVDITRKDLAKMNPVDFVRSLVSPQSPYRQTVENAYLAMCLLIDNNSTDIGLIEKVFRRLQGQNLRMLKELLNYAKTLDNIETVNNLPVYYSRVVDTELQELDLADKSSIAAIRSIIFFLLSCPTEGKHHFNVINQRLSTLSVPTLSALITLGALPTATLSKKSNSNRVALDIDVSWTPEIVEIEDKAQV